ncbi:MAG: endonuclease/exonuclease/phosphatase family protein [Burkholderiales bacterium]|nr:endonuclease/exonuclease/phosphatase family protein [Bacteroidia bacterium]
MKIVSWNCNGALRKKFNALMTIDADIYIIQECENPADSKDKDYKNWASNYLWIGDSKNKGLALFAKENIKLDLLDWSNNYKDHSVKYFLPCMINNDFQLLAVWTHQNNSPNFGYIGQFWKYLQVNKDKFRKIIIVGDLNSNAIWDQWDRWWNHSDVIKELEEISIKSLYHEFYKESQGKEIKPTFFLQKNASKSYHIDYYFSSKEITSNLKGLEVGDFSNWKQMSDHVPMTITLK